MKRLIGILILALTVLAGAQETLNNDSILKMVKAGLGEDLIVTMVQTQPGKYSVNPDELITLKQAGVSERILAAMATKAGGGNPSAPVPSGPAKIAPGTSIRLAVEEAVSSSSAKAGDTLKVVAAEDLVINGRVVIAKGAPAMGRIITVKKKGFASYDGLLEVAANSVRAVDGQNVALDGHLTAGGGAVRFGHAGRDVQLEKGHIITAVATAETTIAD
ncbi:MAG: hypothetical protein ACHP8B_05000 [Terriglobales bacterium]